GPGGGRWGGGMAGGGRGGGRMSMDPNERWNQLTGGKEVWVRSEITDQRQQLFFDMIARSNNIVNGQITRQQFLDAMQQFQQRMRGGGMGGSPGGGPPGGAPGGGPGGGFNPDVMAEVIFKRQDVNQDGLLNYDEMPEALKAEKDRWDTNRDGHIDLNEYKAYFKARVDQMRAERGTSPGGGPGGPAGFDVPEGPVPSLLPEVPGVEQEKKPVVYRAANMPREVPQWFRDIDGNGDKDGQVALWEWKQAGRAVDDFLAMDRNGDGFITVEELLRGLNGGKQPAAGNGGATVAGGPGAGGAPAAGGAPPWAGNGSGGRPAFGGMGPGGRPPWGGGSGRPGWGGSGGPGGGRPSWGGNGPGGRSRGGPGAADGSGGGRGRGRSRGGFGG
ncbi:MAG TPA: hypothetical protein VFA26_13800, partial [Gemmataceae bacterium]|nr:hypothetical protein [Gemmataceae bacterium]